MTQDTSESNQNNPNSGANPPLERTQSSVRADVNAIDQLALFGLLDVIGRWMHSGSTPWTASDLIEKVDVAPRHHWIVRRWLNDLALHGLIDGDKSGWTCTNRPSMKELRTTRTNMVQAASRLGHGPIFANTLLESLRHSAELLRDEITIQSLFFPDGTIEFAKDIYGTSDISSYVNTAAAEAITALATRPIRVLELGAGIGATTAAVAASNPTIEHYAYTDLSPWFLELGQQQFAEQLPLSTHLLDIEESITDQLAGTGAPNSFDVILAANVAHNAPDINALLRRIRNVLRPGGRLLLIEAVKEHPQALITMAYALSLPASHASPEILNSGSGLRRDDERHGSDRTLLTEPEWRTRLTAAGFNIQNVLPDPAHPLHPASQQMFNAQMISEPKEPT